MSNRKMLVKKGAVVVRDGNRVRPEIGKTFPFTADEIKQINKATPGTLVPASEAEAEDGSESAKAASTSGSSAEASQAKARGGKKAATSNKSDEEAAGETDPGAAEDDL